MQWLDGGGADGVSRCARREARNTICDGAVRRLVAAFLAVRRHSWRSTSRQLFGRRLGRGGRRGGSRRSICSTTAACASFPPRFVGGVVELYRGAEARRQARVVHAYELWGFTRSVARNDRGAEHLGALHLRAAGRRPRAQHRRRRQARRIRPSRGLRGGARPQARRGRSRCRANSCSWTAPRSASAALSCGFAPRLNFHRLFEVGDRGIQRRDGRRAAGGGADRGRPRRARADADLRALSRAPDQSFHSHGRRGAIT